MFLKSIDIFGFKSFADKTHIDFSDGITAIVGLNGSGKSNIVDAIKWVLAENKTKNLRAEKKEDVIFNGTQTRAALNVAEVILTINNENRLLPLDTDEIAIKRRLFRSGENEYFLNSKEIGARKLNELFLNTGIGKSAYSVMEQGKIDQVLSSKAEDRRYLFEEAAAISKSKNEFAAASRELETVQNSLAQVEVALNEIQKQYDNLKNQAEKTEKYRRLKDEILETEKKIALLKILEITKTKKKGESELIESSALFEKLTEETKNLGAKIASSLEEVKDMQEKIYEKQKALIKIQSEKASKTQLKRQMEENLASTQRKLSSLKERKRAIKERIDDLEEEMDEAAGNINEEKNALSKVKKNIENFTESIEKCSSGIKINVKRIRESEENIGNANRNLENLSSSVKNLTEVIVHKLEEKIKESSFSPQAAKKANEKLNEILEKTQIFLSGKKKILSDFKKRGESPSGEKLLEAAENAAKDLDFLFTEIKEAAAEVQKYSPDFLSEFLSPEGIMSEKKATDDKINAEKQRKKENEDTIFSLKTENEELVAKINEYKDTLAKLKINEAELSSHLDSYERENAILKRTWINEQNSLKDTEEEARTEENRESEAKENLEELEEELAELEENKKNFGFETEEIEEKIKTQNIEIEEKNEELEKKENLRRENEIKIEKIKGILNAFESEIKNIKQNFEEATSRTLSEEDFEKINENTDLKSLKEKLSYTKKEAEELGQVNFMATEEFREVSARYEIQKSNYEDVQKSINDLECVCSEIKAKASEMFLETYNEIKKNFHNMFRRLFGGGRAELRLKDSEDVLETGIDILAQPPGKKLENISLLSGGEKTMTAIALLFATYQVHPAPFCLLDEIDAALDDKNVLSFVATLESFSALSQYIVITHNKKTVLGAKTMLGIAMEEEGISKVIGIRIAKETDAKDIASLEKAEREIADFAEEDIEKENAKLPSRPTYKNGDIKNESDEF